MKKKKIPYELCHRLNKDGVEEKLCNTCDNWFILNDDNFYKNKSSKDGYFPNCRKCNKAKTSQWQRDNKEKHNENNRKYYAENKWDVKGIMRKNSENRRKIGKYLKWQHSEKGKESARKSNLKRLHKNHNISKEEWYFCKNYFDNKCAYCGIPIDEHWVEYAGKLILSDFHKEHIDDGSNKLDNCAPSCKLCNSYKHQYLLEEWYDVNNPIFSQERLDKINKWRAEDYKLYPIKS